MSIIICNLTFIIYYSIIVDKIDRNNDSKVTKEELQVWIQYVQKRYLVSDVDKQWKTHNLSGKENLTWDDYRKTVYGFSHGNASLQHLKHYFLCYHAPGRIRFTV